MSSEGVLVGDNFISIAIYLYGDSISRADVSRLLGLEPTKFRNRGDTRLTSSGVEVVQKIGFWEYRIKVDDGQVLNCLADLVGRIKCEKIVGCAGVSKAELDIFSPIDFELNQGGFSVELPSSLLNRLSSLGFDVVITSR